MFLCSQLLGKKNQCTLLIFLLGGNFNCSFLVVCLKETLTVSVELLLRMKLQPVMYSCHLGGISYCPVQFYNCSRTVII